MGWDVQVSKDETQHEQFEERVTDAAHSLGSQLGLNDEMADKLFRAGGASAELVAQMPAEYIAQALEVSQEEAEIILSKVKPAEAASEAPVAEPAETPVAEETAEAAPVEEVAEGAPAEEVAEVSVEEVAEAPAEESSEAAESTEA